VSKPFETVQRQRGSLLGAAGLLLLFMSTTLVLIIAFEDGGRLDLAKHWPSLSGLLGMVLVFVLYVQHKHQQLAAVERQLHELAVREATAQARFHELSSLFEASTQLQLRLDLPSMLDLAVQRLLPCLDAHQAAIVLHDEASGMLEVKARSGGDSALLPDAVAPMDEGIVGHVFTTGETLMLTAEMMAERFPDEAQRATPTVASTLCVPMRFRGSSIGVILVTRRDGDPFEPMHAQMLTAFAEHCAATVVKTHHHHDMLAQMRKAA
jgi:transcriptional regulator with GAF, ATPase, and Fis domain